MPKPRRASKPFGYSLNTSTIKGQGLSLAAEIDVIAQAGYDGFEPWVRELDEYVARGGSLRDLSKRIADKGLKVVNLIGFFEWLVDDEQRRSRALDEARRCFDMAAALGCPMVAAPPMGVTGETGFDLRVAAQRYAALIDLGAERGVAPVLEFWGMSKTLGRLSEALYVAAHCGRRQACILADVFHMYKGGSPFEGLRLLGPRTLGLLHINDYPAEPGLDAVTDKDRVYPGDGAAPLSSILADLHAAGFGGMLSVELFNEGYWKQDALTVARTGLDKVKAAVQKALA